jgi:flagellar basal-body rod modification protein FlgD
MDIASTMSAQDLAVTKSQVDSFNKTINNGRVTKAALDKDDFMKILITQLTHQDPTQPMEDKEFIAQMAQFSSLEQMTNMSQSFGKLQGMLSSSQAMGMLGQKVEVTDGDKAVTGVVSEVVRGDYPQLLVDGQYYDFDKVTKVLQRGE